MSDGRDDRLIDELERHGLSTPAHFLLEAHRPLRPLLDHAVTFLSPLARPLLGAHLDEVARAVSDDEAYDRLIDELERRAEVP